MDFVEAAPLKSEAFRQLEEHAASQHIDIGLLREILWLSTAHCQLFSLPSAARRILQILDCVPDSWSEPMEQAGIRHWRPVLEWILDQEDALSARIGPGFSRRLNTGKANPILGSGSTQFPAYAALCEPNDDSRFLLLSAHFFVGHVIAMRSESSVDDYMRTGAELEWDFLPNGVSKAALAVRRLSEQDHHAHLQTLELEKTPESFSEYLESLAPLQHNELERDRQELYRFLQKAHGLLEWRATSSIRGSKNSDGGHLWVGGRYETPQLGLGQDNHNTDDDLVDMWGRFDIITFKLASSRKRNERIDSDLSPDELDDEDEVLLSDFDCSTTKQDPGALARTGRVKARHISKHNQLFSWTYSNLSSSEVAVFLRAQLDATTNLLHEPRWSPQDLIRAEALFALQAMFLTGSHAGRAANMRVALQDEIPGEGELLLVTKDLGATGPICWRVGALSPVYATELQGVPTQLRPQAKFLDLPYLGGMERLVTRIVEAGGVVPCGGRLFKTPEADLISQQKQWLCSIGTKNRITLSKIESTLWSQLHRLTGDPATSSCVTGVMHPLGRVRLHYTSPWVSNLQRHYRSAIDALIPAREIVDAPCLAPGARATVGARLCPTVVAVRSMFDRLKQDIDHLRGAYLRADSKAAHNLYTLYTVQSFAYATTCRAIITPLLDQDAKISPNGLAPLSDKEDECKHKTRLVWIAPVIQEQLAHYDQHRKSLRGQIGAVSPVMRELSCYFFDQDGHPEEVRPKTLTPRIHNYLQVQANTHRRFLRTELLERGCAPEVIDAFMGHWHTGEEPFGKFSSFSIANYVAELQVHLLPLLNEIGIDRVVTSPLA